MSVAGIFLLLAFLAGCALFVTWPLLFVSTTVTVPESGPGTPGPLAQLKAEHETVLTALRDLDFDYQTGKFAEDDYHVQREALVQRGVLLLQRIDAEQSAAVEAAVEAHRRKA